MNRECLHIVIHCSATPEGRHVTVNEITRWHKARGFRTIGYHEVIYLDGSVHGGRPLDDDHLIEPNERGAHVASLNSFSVGLCYVGGMDAANKRAKNTLTEAQDRALLREVNKLLVQFPKAKLSGHNQHDVKACPSFDVRQWAKDRGIPEDRILQKALKVRLC